MRLFRQLINAYLHLEGECAHLDGPFARIRLYCQNRSRTV